MKQIRKRILAMLLTVAMLLSLLTMGASAAETASGTCGKNLTWTLEDGTLTISGTGAMENYYSDSSGPWYDYWFEITSVVLEDGVTTIGNFAFRDCYSLTSVTIPDSVTTIGGFAFDGCDSLASVTIGNGVTSIGSDAFANCTSLTSVVIPDSVTSIGSQAFEYCTSLTSVVIPDSVTSIGGFAFDGCDSLASVTIGSGVTTIGHYAFYNCDSLTSVVIPDSVTAIDEYAFGYCDSLASVTIGSGVTNIGDKAFRNCTSLTSVTIGNGVIRIGEYAFDGCTRLTDVYYGGSEEEWNAISIKSGNECLTDAEIHFAATYTHTESDPVKENEVAATCTKDGSYDSVVYCTFCGVELSRQTVVVPATGHTPVTDVAVAPTCTEDGLTEGSHCSVCGEVLTAQETVPATGHTPVTDAAVAPTCTEEGLTEGSHCSVCGEVLAAQETVPATGHTSVTDAAVAPTCTEEGLTEGSHCSVCGEVLVAQETVPSTGHTPVTDAAVAPACTEDGLTEGSHCSVCGEVMAAQETVPATGHTPVTDAAVAPTCTEEGLTEGSHCSVCGEVLAAQETVPATGHTPGEAKSENVVPATSTEDGSYDSVVYCAVCGVELSRETVVVPATGSTHQHTAGEPVRENEMAATCTEDGSYESVVYCAECLEELSRETVVIPATGHTPVTDAAVAPTCTEPGLTESSHCSVCGEVLVAQETVPATGHSYTYTDNGDGTHTKACSAGDDAATEEHTYVDGVCALCGAEEPAAPQKQFTDVKESDWFYPHVQRAYELGLMAGTSETTFGPYGTTTRAMVVQILYNMAGSPAVGSENPFTDVPSGQWYSNAIQWAYENEVTSGTSDTTFSPNTNVTREQIAVFLYSYCKRPEVSGELAGFTDAGKVSSWAKDAMLWATQVGILSGAANGDGTLSLNPLNQATRAEAATMMVKFYDYMNP